MQSSQGNQLYSHIHVAGRWKVRAENPDAISGRLARWLSQLQQIDGRMTGWSRFGMRHRSVVPRMVTMPPDRAELRDWIAENPVFATRQGRKATIAHSINAGTPDDTANYRCISLQSGDEECPIGFRNQIGLTWLPRRDSPKELTAAVQAIVLATATAWDCEWAGAMPGDFAPPARKGAFSEFRSGWMVYLDRTRAARLAPPKGIAVEHLPDGAALLTTVPSEIFDPARAEHRTAAEHLQAALNALPGPD
jgi:hypothetical protein